MTPLSPPARPIADALAKCEPGEVVAMLIPHQRQDHRQRAIDNYEVIVDELRRAGWNLTTSLYPAENGENGEALAIELLRPPPPTSEGGRDT